MTNKVNTWFVGVENRKSHVSIYYPKQKQNADLVLFAHGFKGFKDWGQFPLVQQHLAKNGFVVVAFNFSHNGGTLDKEIDFPDLEAFSKNTYEKELEDVGHVLNWIHEKRDEHFIGANTEQIHLIGHSRGGGIALLAGNKFDAIKKVVTWAAVADFLERLPNEEELRKWKDRGVYFIKNGRTNQDMPMDYDFVESLLNHRKELNIQNAVQSLEKQLLVVHGAKDETVTKENAERITSWKKDAQKVVIKEGNHTFNGKHPWEESYLPRETLEALEASIKFLKT